MTSRPAAPARRLAALALLAAALAPSALRGQESELARAVKATFLYKFAPFVEWPAAAFGSPADPLRICVAGDEEIVGLVRRGAAGQRVGDREMVVESRRELAPRDHCHILYLGGEGGEVSLRHLESARGLPVLTVTDERTEDGARGIVHFVIRDGRVRFEIDTRLAEEAGLHISPSVLELALRVTR
jgi:hypothetical protein